MHHVECRVKVEPGSPDRWEAPTSAKRKLGLDGVSSKSKANFTGARDEDRNEFLMGSHSLGYEG